MSNDIEAVSKLEPGCPIQKIELYQNNLGTTAAVGMEPDAIVKSSNIYSFVVTDPNIEQTLTFTPKLYAKETYTTYMATHTITVTCGPLSTTIT